MNNNINIDNNNVHNNNTNSIDDSKDDTHISNNVRKCSNGSTNGLNICIEGINNLHVMSTYTCVTDIPVVAFAQQLTSKELTVYIYVHVCI